MSDGHKEGREMAEANRIRVAVIGAGYMARSAHLPSLRDIEGAEVAAICRPPKVSLMISRDGPVSMLMG